MGGVEDFGLLHRPFLCPGGGSICCVQSLGAARRENSIVESVLQHFAESGHNPDVHDVVYENAQARERTQILD